MRAFAVLSALATAAFAAPAYIPYAYNESIPEIHGKPVNANNLAFWIGKNMTATCASWDPNCPSENTTIISGPTKGFVSNAQFWLGILEEGGQGIYMDIPGHLQYAVAGTNNAASTTKPSFGEFYVEYDAEIGTVLRMTVRGTGHFEACYEEGDDAYSVYTLGQGYPRTCYGFEMALVNTTAAAVYNYD